MTAYLCADPDPTSCLQDSSALAVIGQGLVDGSGHYGIGIAALVGLHTVLFKADLGGISYRAMQTCEFGASPLVCDIGGVGAGSAPLTRGRAQAQELPEVIIDPSSEGAVQAAATVGALAIQARTGETVDDLAAKVRVDQNADYDALSNECAAQLARGIALTVAAGDCHHASSGLATVCLGADTQDPEVLPGETIFCGIQVVNLNSCEPIQVTSIVNCVHHASGDICTGNLLEAPVVLVGLGSSITVSHTDVVQAGDGPVLTNTATSSDTGLGTEFRSTASVSGASLSVQGGEP